MENNENNNETKNITIKSTQQKIKFIEPPKPKFNIIEKNIRKNPKLLKLLKNTNFISALTIKTEEIPNKIYITKINESETILDYLLQKYGYIFNSIEIEKRTKENIEILEIYLKHKILPISYNTSDEFLLTKIYNTSLLEYILNNFPNVNLNDFNLISRIENNEKICNILFNYFIKKDNIEKNEERLTVKTINNSSKEKTLEFYKKFFEQISQKYPSIENEIIKKADIKTIQYLINKNEINLIKKFIKLMLIQDCNKENVILFFILLKTNIINLYDYISFINNIIKIMAKNKMIVELEYILHNKIELLSIKDKNTILLETIFDDLSIMLLISKDLKKELIDKANENITYAKIFVKKFIENPKYIEALALDGKILEEKYNEEETLYETIIKGLKKLLEKKEYTIFYLYPISKTFLLYKYNNKTLLEILLKNGSSETFIDNIISLSSDLEINTILKLNNINISYKFNIETPFEHEKNKIIQEKYESYQKNELNEEQKQLIQQLKNTFLEDGKSDIEIIDLACNAFKYSFLNNYKYTKRDLENLINIKINNPHFVLVKSKIASFSKTGKIEINNIYDIDAFNHELAHAIHEYSVNEKMPENLKIGTSNINEEEYDKFIKEFIEESEKILKKFNEKDFYSENLIAIKESKDYNTKINEILDSARYTYDEEIIKYLKENISIEEEYKEYYNKITSEELSLIYIEKYKTSIIDIIDAIKKGKIYDEGLHINGNIIHIGHGGDYYESENIIFDEILAQYTSIIKSPYKEEALNILKKIVGPELIEILDKFNEELIVNKEDLKKSK